VRVDEDRTAAGAQLLAGVLVVADQLLLLGVYADHRFFRGKRRAGDRGDVLELRVAVGVIGSLPALAVGLQGEPHRLQHPAHRAGVDREPLLTQLDREMLRRQRRPQKRRHRIARGDAVRQRQERLLKARLALCDPLASTASTTDPARRRLLTRLDLREPTAHRRFREPRRSNNSSDTATTVGARLGRRPQTPPTLIQSTHDDQPPLADRRLIDHRPQHRP